MNLDAAHATGNGIGDRRLRWPAFGTLGQPTPFLERRRRLRTDRRTKEASSVELHGTGQ